MSEHFLSGGAVMAGGAWVAPAVLATSQSAAAAASAVPGQPSSTTLGRVLIVFIDSSNNFYSLAYEYYQGSWQAVLAGESLKGLTDPYGGSSDASLLSELSVPVSGGPISDYTPYFSIAGGSDPQSLTIDAVGTTGPYGLALGIIATIASAGTVYPGYLPSGALDDAPPDVNATYQVGASTASSITFTAPTL